MNATDAALYGKLSSDTALTTLLGGTAIYNAVIPRDAALPCVVFWQISGVDENATPRRSERLIYGVKGVANTLYQAGQLADRIDALLHQAALAVTGYGTAFWVARESEISYMERDPVGHDIGHRGGEYAIRIATP